MECNVYTRPKILCRSRSSTDKELIHGYTLFFCFVSGLLILVVIESSCCRSCLPVRLASQSAFRFELVRITCSRCAPSMFHRCRLSVVCNSAHLPDTHFLLITSTILALWHGDLFVYCNVTASSVFDKESGSPRL